CVVHEFIAFAFGRPRWLSVLFPGRCPRLYPSLAAVIGALNDLPEPAAGLRRIDAIRICGRTLEVIHLPTGKMRSADVPFLALAVRCQDKCTLARSNQYPYSAHRSLLPINSKAAAGAYLWFRCRKSSLVYITVSVVPKPPLRRKTISSLLPGSFASSHFTLCAKGRWLGRASLQQVTCKMQAKIGRAS